MSFSVFFCFYCSFSSYALKPSVAVRIACTAICWSWETRSHCCTPPLSMMAFFVVPLWIRRVAPVALHVGCGLYTHHWPLRIFFISCEIWFLLSTVQWAIIYLVDWFRPWIEDILSLARWWDRGRVQIKHIIMAAIANECILAHWHKLSACWISGQTTSTRRIFEVIQCIWEIVRL